MNEDKNWEAFGKYRRTFRLSDEFEQYAADVVFKCGSELLNYEGKARVFHNLKGTHGSNTMRLEFETKQPIPEEYRIDCQSFSFDETLIITGKHPVHGKYTLEIFPLIN